MDYTQEKSTVAQRVIKSIPFIRATANQNNTDEPLNESLTAQQSIAKSMEGISSALSGILKLLVHFIKDSQAKEIRSKYSAVEAQREDRAQVSNRVIKPKPAATFGKDSLLSMLGKGILGAAILAFFVGILPEDVKKNLYKYVRTIMTGVFSEEKIKGLEEKYEDIKNTLQTFSDTVKEMSDFIESNAKPLLAALMGVIALRTGRKSITPTTGKSAPRSGGFLRTSGGGKRPDTQTPIAAVAGVVTGAAVTTVLTRSLKSENPGDLKIANNEKARQAYDFFISEGWSPEQSAGIVGNLLQESQLNEKSFNPEGGGRGAKGIAQWRGERQTRFEEIYGKSLDESSFAEQLEYVNWELNNTEKKAGDELRKAVSVSKATQVVQSKYERSGEEDAKKTMGKREGFATQVAAMSNNSPPKPTSTPNNVQTAALNNPSAYDGSDGSIQTAALNNPSAYDGSNISRQTVDNRDAMKGSSAVSLSSASLPTKVTDLRRGTPSTRPNIPIPWLGGSELDATLFFRAA